MSELDMTAIAVAVAGSIAKTTADAALEGGRKAMGALVDFVRARLGKDPNGEVALAAVEESPEDNADLLAQTMSLIARIDPEFREGLARHWGIAQAQMVGGSGNVSMNFSGKANNVYQVGNVNTFIAGRDRE